jgi:peptidoglycan/LPS O-acetylase OafA/YrhL
MTIAQKRPHFELLDGLRGIAAFAVVAMHAAEMLQVPDWLPQAYLAVPFFFMLSGFVITFAYERSLMQTESAVGFMLVRIRRLYPLLLAGLVLGVGLAIVQSFVGKGGYSLSGLSMALVSSLVMIPMSSGNAFGLLPPQWSLAIELWGNLLHYILRRILTPLTLLLIMLVSLGFVTAAAIKFGGLAAGWDVETLLWGFAIFAFTYAAGIAIHRAWEGGKLTRIKLPLIVILFALCGALAIPQPLRNFDNAVRDLLCTILVFPVVIIAALNVSIGPRMVSIAKFFGRISYPLYITHYPIVTAGCLILLRLKAPLWALYLAIPMIALAAVVAAWMFLLIVDDPVRRYFRAKSQ